MIPKEELVERLIYLKSKADELSQEISALIDDVNNSDTGSVDNVQINKIVEEVMKRYKEKDNDDPLQPYTPYTPYTPYPWWYPPYSPYIGDNPYPNQVWYTTVKPQWQYTTTSTCRIK